MSKPLDGHHVAVLLGGLSPEREVSLSSGAEASTPQWL
jgi:D-alanine-D-alanine ligase